MISSIARKFLTAALVYLVLGLLLQTIVLFDLWLGFNPLTYTSVGATEQALLFGWLSQGGLALIYDRWLPRPKYGQTAFWLFNLGLPSTIVGQPALALLGLNWLGALIAMGGLLQLAGGGFAAWEIIGFLRQTKPE